MPRSWKKTAWIVAGIVAAAAATLVFFEVERRRKLSNESKLLQPGDGQRAKGPEELAEHFESPENFQAFLRKVNEKYLAMNARFKSHQHRRRERTKELDGAGKVLGDEEVVWVVDFPDGKERTRVLERTDRATGEKITGKSNLQESLASRRTPYAYAFNPDATWDDFQYSYVGVELLGGKPVVKLQYVPNPPFGRKFAAAVWADAETGQPIRFHGRWHKPQFPVDRHEMLVDYAKMENGGYQIRRIESDGSGGLAFYTRRYTSVVDIDDYRPMEGK